MHSLLDASAAIEALHDATAFFTEAPVVDALLDRIGWPAPGLRLLDPSAGDGAILLRALRRLALRPGDDLSSVLGVEIHPEPVQDGRDAIAGLLRERGWAFRDAASAARRVLLHRDFITDGVPADAGRFGLVVGNPPYLRWQGVPAVLQAAYEPLVPRMARADLLHAFLDACVGVLAPGGVMAMVTADRWLFNANAAALRASLGRRFGLGLVERLDAASAFYRPKKRRKGSPPRVHPVALTLRPAAEAAIVLGSAPIRIGAPLVARSDRTLADVAEVNLAPWLGTKGIFVLTHAEAEAAKLPAAMLVPAVNTRDACRDTDTLRPARRVVLMTDPDRQPPAAVMAHLRATYGRMCPGGRRTPIWRHPEVYRGDLAQPGLLLPRIARKLRVVDLSPGILPISHDVCVARGKAGVPLEELAALLRSPRSQDWVARCAPPLDQEHLSITVELLRGMPVPAVGGSA